MPGSLGFTSAGAAEFGGEDRTYCQLGGTPHSEESPLPAVLGRTTVVTTAAPQGATTTAGLPTGAEGETELGTESESGTAGEHPGESNLPVALGGVLLVVVMSIAIAAMTSTRKRPVQDRMVVNHAAVANAV